MAAKLEFDKRMLTKLRKAMPEALKDLEPLTRRTAASVVAASQPLVPSDTGNLRSSAFIDGTKDEVKGYVKAHGGYEHPQAGPIHEGVHWNIKVVSPPPHFLKKPARKAKNAFKKAVAAQLLATFQRLFSSS